MKVGYIFVLPAATAATPDFSSMLKVKCARMD